jgi:hypothetical protein
MVVRSDTRPEQIQIDKIEDGKARLQIHWDITEQERSDEQGTRMEYQYSERVLWWTLPQKYDSVDEVLTYLTSISAELLNWAQATELSVSGPPLNVPVDPEVAAQRVHDMAVSALNTQYIPQFESLQGAYMAALILGDADTMAANRVDYQALLNEYNAALEAIE